MFSLSSGCVRVLHGKGLGMTLSQGLYLFQTENSMLFLQYCFALSNQLVKSFRGLFSCAKKQMGEKLVGGSPKTKLAESQFLKRINCHLIKMN